MNKYVVICEACDPAGASPIAWIDDDRELGGLVTVGSNTRFTKAPRTQLNKRGGAILYTIGCIRCGIGFPDGITNQTIGEFLDDKEVVLISDKLPVLSVPALIQPEPVLTANQRRERRDYGRRKIEALLQGDPDVNPPRDPRWYPAATVFEDRRKISLKFLCKKVSTLRSRGKQS